MTARQMVKKMEENEAHLDIENKRERKIREKEENNREATASKERRHE